MKLRKGGGSTRHFRIEGVGQVLASCSCHQSACWRARDSLRDPSRRGRWRPARFCRGDDRKSRGCRKSPPPIGQLEIVHCAGAQAGSTKFFRSYPSNQTATQWKGKSISSINSYRQQLLKQFHGLPLNEAMDPRVISQRLPHARRQKWLRHNKRIARLIAASPSLRSSISRAGYAVAPPEFRRMARAGMLDEGRIRRTRKAAWFGRRSWRGNR